MKIKKSVLRQIIKEELQNILKLVSDFADMNKFAKEKTYHDEETDFDDGEISACDDMSHSMLGMGGGKRKQPTDYLSGGANEKSVSDHIMMDDHEEDCCETDSPDIVVRWQQLAESKRR